MARVEAVQHLPRPRRWHGTLALAVVAAGARRAAAVVVPCPPEDNSTPALLRCVSWRHEQGEHGFTQKSWEPTEKADDEAVEHLRRLKSQTEKPQRFYLRGATLERFRKEVLDWESTGIGMPLIYPLGGGKWERVCEFTQTTLGYRYSLEHWLFHLLRGNAASTAQSVDEADYLYLPHCATGVFMHLVARDEVEARNEVREAPVARKRRRRNITDEWLVYEGNLPKKAVTTLNNQYLTHMIRRDWVPDEEFQACVRRPRCRILIVSIYGRHVWRTLANFFGDKAVWLTHAGLSGWLGQQEPRFFLGGLGPDDDSGSEETSCRASCDEHCVLEPPAIRPQDVVLPWIVAFQWNARSARTERDIYAFYSGTRNSCSRELLERVFDTAHLREEIRRADDRGKKSLQTWKQRFLVFPANFRLLQHEWSELAFRSRLCLVPDGDSPNTGRLVEVIMHGCVPVIISDRLQPPYHEYIDWPSLAFFVREASIPVLPELLWSLATPEGAQHVEAKQKRLEQVAHMFDYDGDVLASMALLALRERSREWRLQQAVADAAAAA